MTNENDSCYYNVDNKYFVIRSLFCQIAAPQSKNHERTKISASIAIVHISFGSYRCLTFSRCLLTVLRAVWTADSSNCAATIATQQRCVEQKFC